MVEDVYCPGSSCRDVEVPETDRVAPTVKQVRTGQEFSRVKSLLEMFVYP